VCDEEVMKKHFDRHITNKHSYAPTREAFEKEFADYELPKKQWDTNSFLTAIKRV